MEYSIVDVRREAVMDEASGEPILPVSSWIGVVFLSLIHILALTSREFVIDGIKRDRWVWAGDTFQSELMSFYSFFDKETMKRTIGALLGKDCFEQDVYKRQAYSGAAEFSTALLASISL